MARIARVVPEGMPHHITQRGNRRQKTSFSNEDYAAYISGQNDNLADCSQFLRVIWLNAILATKNGIIEG